MSPSKRTLSVAVSSALFAVFAASCAVQDATPLPSCERGDSAIIAAQSVPSAEMLPCFTPLPLGWEVDGVGITDDGTTIRFDSDRAGEQAAKFEFDKWCDRTGAAQQPSDQEEVERFARTDRAGSRLQTTFFYLFEGGCATWQFDFDDDVQRAELTVLEETLVFVPRTLVSDQLAESFIDREL